MENSSLLDNSTNSPTSVPNLNLISDCQAESENEHVGSLKRISKHRMPSSLNKKQMQGSHPGVILLGRGNSFSLGRSEVIFVHRKKQALTDSDKKWEMNGTVSDCNTLNGRDVHSGPETLLSDLPPPPLSNGSCDNIIPTTIQGAARGADDVRSGFEENYDLDLLWAKVESVMFARKAAVQKVLEDFGISQAGGGEDEERGLEEENIWQVVEEDFQV